MKKLLLCTLIAALPCAGLLAQTSPKAWPTKAPYTVAIEAFDAALTKAGWDRAFRDRLIKSPDSAKEAVQEVANVTIPDDRVIVFFEAQGPANDSSLKSLNGTPAPVAAKSKSSENVHVFYLPPLKENDKTNTYKYEDYLRCCYDQWRRP